MALSRVKTWVTGDLLTAADLNAEFNNILNNPVSLISSGSTWTQYALSYASTTGVLVSLGAATNGQLPIGSTGAAPVLATLTGTANQITVTNGAGTITLATPQSIATGSSPTFANVTLTTALNIQALTNHIVLDSDAAVNTGTLTMAALTGARVWTFPNVTGTVVTTGDSASVTNAMLAGSIAASKLIGTDIATVGTITAGTWQGTTLGVGYGGTGLSTIAINELLFASSANVLGAVAAGTADQVLRVPGAGGAPAFGTVDLSKTAAVTGVLLATGFPVLTGDITTAGGALATTLKNTGPGATGPIGSATVTPIVTIDAQGRVTALTSATIVAGALTREGGNLTEGTTTSTTTVDIIAVTGLSVAATKPILIVAKLRKTAGAAATASVGLRVQTATTNNTPLTNVAWASATNQAEGGIFWALLGPRSGGLANVGTGFAVTTSNEGSLSSLRHVDAGFDSGAATGNVTEIDITGLVGNASVTMGVDEVHVYSFASS